MATFYRNRYFTEIFCLVPLFWDISSRTDVFLKSQFFSKSLLNLVRFDTKFVAVRKILLTALWQGSLGSSV